ncbi:MAG TPA: hypothetical protein VHW74_18600 [Mycobacteriales bacterium]|jgi:hypothetical protein|nr:hypothetical protein [Mycobacteriales bacterium]
MDRITARIAILAVGMTALVTSAASPAIAAPHDANINSTAQADLRRLAVDEETYLTDNDHYAGFSQLAKDPFQRIRVRRGMTLAILHLDGDRGYCLAAATKTGHFVYDSEAGGLHLGSFCPVTTHGRSGGVRRGPASVG